MTLYTLSCVIALVVAFHKDLPETTSSLTITRSLLLFLPFQAFVAVRFYNDDPKTLPKLVFISLSSLLAINLLGFYGLGLTNEIHSISGRINFPFMDGLYSGASLVAILSLMLLYYFKKIRNNPFLLTGWVLYFMLNLFIMFYINSRLTIMVFLIVVILQLVHATGRSKLIYWISLFTLPILLNTGQLVYRILSQPFFISILKRVDLIDVTTFNGRAFLWQDALDWLFYDQRGLLFGNGYRGHYFLGITANVAKLWHEEHPYHLHLHSSSLEILVSQGLVVYLLFLFLLYHGFRYYQKMYQQNEPQGVMLAVLIFLLFILQVDTFLYMESLGFLLFAFIISKTAVKAPSTATSNSTFKHVKMIAP